MHAPSRSPTWLTAASLRLLATLALLAAAGGCEPGIPGGTFRCDPDVPDQCPSGWVCQNRGTTGEYLCYPDPGANCGNQRIDPDEQCDGTALPAGGCEALGKPGGLIICRSDCTVFCTECGNGVLEILADGRAEQCDDGNTVSEDGCSADCRLEFCGDGIRQEGLGEECDNGTNQPGSGCNPRCQVERCGNGWVDAGEECDDVDPAGRGRSHDGCSSGCTVEAPLWSPWTDPMPARVSAATVTDTQRHRVLLFGGTTGSALLADTWSYDGNHYQPVETLSAPPARQRHAMAYDSARDRVVLFGGQIGPDLAATADTWEFDGTDWIERLPEHAPTARAYHAMAYDHTGGVVVLFGGTGGSSSFGDTWTWDGVDWTPLSPPTAPAARHSHTLAWHAGRARLVLFGGAAGGGLSPQTWEFDGATWTERVLPLQPPGRQGGAMAYDALRDRLLLLGGLSTEGGVLWLEDLWAYDDLGWSPITPAPGAVLGAGLAAAYLPETDEVLVAGGSQGIQITGEHWIYTGDQWFSTRYPTAPAARLSARMVEEEGRGTVLLFGGERGTVLRDDAWRFDGIRWWPVTSATSPTPRKRPYLAWDPLREVVILHGGELPLGARASDTWELGNDGWQERFPANRPPARVQGCMAWDAGSDRAILFGGVGGSDYLQETWAYDGNTWVEVPSVDRPGPRTSCAMAWDPGLGRLVLFGGIDAGLDVSSDTWSFDGDQWSPLPASPAPPPRASAHLAYNLARSALVLSGGMGTGFQALTDTWELRGSAWTEISAPTPPPPRIASAGAFLRSRSALVTFGGTDGLAPAADTWLFRFQSPWPGEVCGDGIDNDSDGLVDCADPDCQCP